jgi:hypothetical protein
MFDVESMLHEVGIIKDTGGMNFVLDFFVDKDTHPFDIGEMRLLFASSLFFYEKVQSHKSPTWRVAREFVYDNGTTGVHFTLRYNKPGDFDLTAGKLTYSGLCLEMDLPKAGFFGYEAMRVVAEVMKNLNLLAACSSHMPEVPEPPQRYSYDELVKLWLGANEQEAKEELAKRDDLHYAERNKLLYWWRYTMELKKLQTGMKAKEVSVPEITVCSLDGSTEAVTVCDWPGMVKTVLPVVDYIFVERRAKPSSCRQPRGGPRVSSRMPATRKIERGMARFKDIVRVLRGFSKHVEKPLPYLIYLKNHTPSALKQELQSIELLNPKKFEPLTPDELTDIRLNAKEADKTGDLKQRSRKSR